MQEIDINSRIRQLCELRGWTIYRLAKESGITYSTLCTMLNKSNLPSIPTLFKICNGFQITLSEFFDFSNQCTMPTEEQKAFLSVWERLSPEDQYSAE